MAPLVIPEELLLEQTKDNKKEILRLIKERILQNKTANPNNLRDGLPKPFLYGDEIFKIKNVSEFGRSGKTLQLGRVTDAKKIREAMLRAMTDKTGAARKTAYGRGARKLFANQEDHHILFRTLLDKFYENLDPDDAAELTAHLARRGSPTGNVIENLQGVDIDLHDSKSADSIHQWARNMGIDSKSFPDLTGLDFDARTAALDEWLDLVEQPLLEKTAETLAKQDLRRYGKDGLPKPTKGFKDRPSGITKEDWLEYLNNQRQNVKARANLLDKYPILDVDLDSPDIRPELKARYQKALDLVPEEDLNLFKSLTPEVTQLGGKLGGERTLIRRTGHLLKDRIGNVIRPIKGVVRPIIGAAPYVGAGLAIEGAYSGITRAAENPTAENIGYAAGKTLAAGLEIDPTGITPTIVDTATETFLTPEGRKNWKDARDRAYFTTM